MKRHVVMFLSIVLLALTPLLTASQGVPPMPATPVPGGAPVGMLAEFNLRHLPTPHAEVWFLRMELEPDGSLPMGQQAGPTIVYVEAGELALSVDGPVIRESGQAAEEPDELTLARAESLFVPAGTGISFVNGSDAPTTFLVLLMYSAMEEGEGDEGMEQPVGLSQMGVSVGTAEFQDVPATVVIERIAVEPGEEMQSGPGMTGMMGPGWMGMDLGAIESGSADLTVERESMDALWWPGMLDNEMPEPEQMPLTGTFPVGAGDAYAVFNSTLTWTTTGDEPLTILRAVITPEMGGPGS